MKSPLTTLCYVEKDEQYLMLHRISKKNDVNKDKWIGIGGHFEEGESPEECLLRKGGDRADANFVEIPGDCDFYCERMAAGIYVSVHSGRFYGGDDSLHGGYA